MNAAGIKDEQVTVIIALGTPPFHDGGGDRGQVRQELGSRVRIKNHDMYKNPAALIELEEPPAERTSRSIAKSTKPISRSASAASFAPHPGLRRRGEHRSARSMRRENHGGDPFAERQGTALVPRRGTEPGAGGGERNRPASRDAHHLQHRLEPSRQAGARLLRRLVRRSTKVCRYRKRSMRSKSRKKPTSLFPVLIPAIWNSGRRTRASDPFDLALKAGGTLIIISPCYVGLSVTHADITDWTSYTAEELRSRVRPTRLTTRWPPLWRSRGRR